MFGFFGSDSFQSFHYGFIDFYITNGTWVPLPAVTLYKLQYNKLHRTARLQHDCPTSKHTNQRCQATGYVLGL